MSIVFHFIPASSARMVYNTARRISLSLSAGGASFGSTGFFAIGGGDSLRNKSMVDCQCMPLFYNNKGIEKSIGKDSSNTTIQYYRFAFCFPDCLGSFVQLDHHPYMEEKKPFLSDKNNAILIYHTSLLLNRVLS